MGRHSKPRTKPPKTYKPHKRGAYYRHLLSQIDEDGNKLELVPEPGTTED
jgi:hypothetical protein